MSGSPSDLRARRRLAGHRALAHALLLLMAGLALLARRLPNPWGGPLSAAASAGLIGGLADWFAVTALFRRPLGLPIPHTAILPREQVRLAGALGRFVAEHVFTEAELTAFLRRFDLPRLIGAHLANPARAEELARFLAPLLPGLWQALGDGRVRAWAGRFIARLIAEQGPEILARVLSALIEGGKHQEAFGFLLAELKATITAKDAALRAAIAERVREQGGRLIGWALGAAIARRVIAALETELDRMGPEGSELREAFDEWVSREVAKLEADPALAAEIRASFRRVLGHPALTGWVADVWGRLGKALGDAAADPQSRLTAALAAEIAAFGERLAADPTLAAPLAEGLERALLALLPSFRAELARFITEVVASWETESFVRRLELRIGTDLQYIRINGTVFGFCAGGLLYLGNGWLAGGGW
jgi:uncharacterized membrane-anchored protein YjiN (DUF445 family)